MSELHCDDVERLRSALSWMGYATPEGLEACCARQDDLVRDLIRAVLAQKKTIMDGKFVDCACGDRYPAISYGAGFIDAAGHCPNCDASLPAAEEDARDGWISVERGLPTKGMKYLVTADTDEGPEVFEMYLNQKGQWEHEGEPTFCHSYYIEVTHWQPKPAPAMSQDSKGEV